MSTTALVSALKRVAAGRGLRFLAVLLSAFAAAVHRGASGRTGSRNGATGPTYTVNGSDFAKALSVRVTGSQAGYVSVAKVSAPTAKVPSARSRPATRRRPPISARS